MAPGIIRSNTKGYNTTNNMNKIGLNIIFLKNLFSKHLFISLFNYLVA